MIESLNEQDWHERQIMTTGQIGWEPNPVRSLHEVHLPGDTRAGAQLLDQIAVELQAAGFEPKEVRAIELAATEAFVNAVRHGNHNDPANRFVSRTESTRKSSSSMWKIRGRALIAQTYPIPHSTKICRVPVDGACC